MHRSTIQDVAKEAGVSITTVSRVMNKNYPVAEKTRKKVEEAVEKLNFMPNMLARGLIQNSTKTIGILTPSLENLFFSEVIKGIDQVMGSKGYTTFLCNTAGEGSKEKELIENLMNRQVDGIIMIDPRRDHLDSGYLEKLAVNLPLLLINGHSQGIQCNYVLNDAESGVLEALKYYESEGYSNIALLRGKKSYSYDLKEEIYRRFMEERGLPVNVVRIRDGNDVHTVEQAEEAITELMSRDQKVDALLACNDWMAVGALNAARAMDRSVPGDFRIIGFDNTIISQITSPKLSTVDQQMTRLGELAATRIYKMMTKEDQEQQKLYLATKLIIRES